MILVCPSGHSDNFCAGYSDGYSNWWHQADQKNSGIQQGQSINAQIKERSSSNNTNQSKTG